MVRHKREPGIFEAIRVTDELLKSQLFRTIDARKGWWVVVNKTDAGAHILAMSPEAFDEQYEAAIKSELSIFEHCEYLVGLLRPDLRDAAFNRCAETILSAATDIAGTEEQDDALTPAPRKWTTADERERQKNILAIDDMGADEVIGIAMDKMGYDRKFVDNVGMVIRDVMDKTSRGAMAFYNNVPSEKMIDLALDRILKSDHMGVMHHDEVNKRNVMVRVLKAIALAKHIRSKDDAGVTSDVEKITITLRHDRNSADIEIMPIAIERVHQLCVQLRNEAEAAKESADHNGSFQGGLNARDKLDIVEMFEGAIA
jgi:hypothetical protein